MSVKHILVAVDQSDEANEVLAAAKDVAGADTKVSIITVVKPVASLYGGVEAMAGAATTMANFDTEAQQHALAYLKELGAAHGVEPQDVKVTLGKPSIQIRDHASDIGADVIVIGTHGRKGLGMLLGSTANAVLHGVRCNVYVVKIHNDE